LLATNVVSQLAELVGNGIKLVATAGLGVGPLADHLGLIKGSGTRLVRRHVTGLHGIANRAPVIGVLALDLVLVDRVKCVTTPARWAGRRLGHDIGRRLGRRAVEARLRRIVPGVYVAVELVGQVAQAPGLQALGGAHLLEVARLAVTKHARLGALVQHALGLVTQILSNSVRIVTVVKVALGLLDRAIGRSDLDGSDPVLAHQLLELWSWLRR